MFLGLICWSLERKFPRVTHISTEQLDEKIQKKRWADHYELLRLLVIGIPSFYDGRESMIFQLSSLRNRVEIFQNVYSAHNSQCHKSHPGS